MEERQGERWEPGRGGGETDGARGGKERERQIETDRQTDRDRERLTHNERQTDRDRNRETEEKDRQRKREEEQRSNCRND